jgi:hypothetical protein
MSLQRVPFTMIEDPQSGFRNAIINGNFDVWQRGTSFANPTAAFSPAYLADRWFISGNGILPVRTFTREAFALGQTEVPGEPAYFLRYAHTTPGDSATTNDLGQAIEGVRTFAGQRVTISFYAKGAASLTLPVIALVQKFGAGGSPSADVTTNAATNVAVTTAWQRFTYTLTVPSITGKTIGTDGTDHLRLLIRCPLNQNFTLDLGQVQVEPGPVATPFERRPIAQELLLCQRYFSKSYSVAVAPGTVTTDGQTYIESDSSGLSGIGQTTFFPVQMRATPSIVIYNPVTGASNSARRGTSNVTPSIVSTGERCFAFIAPGGGAASSAGHWTAAAEL